MGLIRILLTLAGAMACSLSTLTNAIQNDDITFKAKITDNDFWQRNFHGPNNFTQDHGDTLPAPPRIIEGVSLRNISQMMKRMSSPTCEFSPNLTLYSAGQSVKLRSPRYPKRYPNYAACGWHLASADPNVRFKISCAKFRLQSPRKKICFDYLSLDGFFYCGKVFPKKWISSTNQVFINFVSDHKKNFQGFSCKVKAIDASSIDSTKCSPNPVVNTLPAGSSMIITSPKYPRSYPNNEECGWYVQGEDWNVRLEVTCNDFLLQDRWNSCPDFLALNQEEYCGSVGPSGWISGSSQATFWFSSNKRLRRRGFSCTITAVNASSYGIGESTNCKCGQVNRGSRIIGGQNTEVNEYPWQVALVYRETNDSFCGGSIINNKYVVTAAHCPAAVPDFQIVVGGHSWTDLPSTFQRLEYETYYYNPNYNSYTQDSDMVLVRLFTTLDFNDPGVAPICPPDPSSAYYGVSAIVTGWGFTQNDGATLPDELQEVEITTITNTECEAKYMGYTVTSNMLCGGHPGGGKDSCQGDSGGPLITEEGDHYVQIGVVSWGVSCGEAAYPGVYATIGSQMTWINSIASSGETCPK